MGLQFHPSRIRVFVSGVCLILSDSDTIFFYLKNWMIFTSYLKDGLSISTISVDIYVGNREKNYENAKK